MIYLALAASFLWLFWFSERYAWWGKTLDLKRARVLMYHMVKEPTPGAKFNGLRVSPDLFERQVRWLSEDGWRFVTMSELVDQPPGDKVVAITFDDGFEDNYLNAFPISDEQIREMLASGVFELGGHTTTHANLAKLNNADKYNEIAASKEHLESLFSCQLSSFAYPFGIYDQQIDPQLVKKAGFDSAVTTEDGIPLDVQASLYELPRIKISGKDGFFAFKIRMQRGKRGLRK